MAVQPFRFPAARISRAVTSFLLVSILWGLAGCGERAAQRVSVSGSVSLNGQPVDNATIIFTPQGSGLAAAALIRNGQFQMGKLDGPTPGEHSIRINPNTAELEETLPANLAHANRQPAIPKVYQLGGQLTAHVTDEPSQTLSFELTSKHFGKASR